MEYFIESENSETFCKTHNEKFKELWPDYWACEICFKSACSDFILEAIEEVD